MALKPTFVFVHGAWHSRDCWSDLTAALETQGYPCIAPQLEFCGTATPVDSIAGSIDQLQSIFAEETKQGRNVVLVNHSFGGAVGCSAVKGFTRKDPSRLNNNSGRVVGIIQLSAFMPPSNICLFDMIDRITAFHHSGPDGWEVIDNGDANDLFYNDLPPAVADSWKQRLLKQSTATFEDRENVYAGWMDVPVAYILATHDHAIPVEVQEAMVTAAKKAGASITSRSLDSSHGPFLSRVDDTVDLFLDAIQEF